MSKMAKELSMTRISNSLQQTYYSLYVDSPLNGFKIDPESLLQLKQSQEIGYKIKIDKLNLLCDAKINCETEVDEDLSRSRSISFQSMEPLSSTKTSPLPALKRLLDYDENDNQFYEEFFRCTEMMSQQPDFQAITDKISKDVIRTQNVPSYHNFCISELFQNIQIEHFVRFDLQKLNYLLFQRYTTIDFQLDCLMLFFITEIVSFRLRHFQQGYAELIAIVLTLFVQSYELTSEIIDEEKLIPFIAQNAQLSIKLITKFHPALSQFNLSEENPEAELHKIQRSFMSTLKSLDKQIYKFLQAQSDIQPLFLLMMDWNCSAFTRVFGFSQTLFACWGDALRSSEICEVFIGKDVKIFIKLCETYFAENGREIDNFVQFLSDLQKIRIEWN